MKPPEMIFVLASPRSGSTLLRVMLAGHSQLFSPPELNLLPFSTMGERDRELGAGAHRVINCDQRVGLVEAVMSLLGLDVERSEQWVHRWVTTNISVERMYFLLRSIAAPRRLVDKATLNASSKGILRRSVEISPS